jgi:soluble lytic murein transglycosylase-like protein
MSICISLSQGRLLAELLNIHEVKMKSRIYLSIAACAAIISSVPTISYANSDPLAFIQLQQSAPTQAVAKARVGKQKTRVSRVERSASRSQTAGRGPAAGAVASLASRMGVPRNLALAVCSVESRCRFGLVGAAGERGPMQIKLATARGLGYRGGAAGLNGYAGAYWGVKHLAVAYNKCGTARGAARLHNSGLGSSCGGSAYTSRVMARL